ncbi:hypothetical protein MLD38_036513 [Melastoma candidum]|uniref:Uncharacterized protein n=1 Tax=Melastoma candidum TaxID=119954 RepID=A0ACB9LKC0_9MYRT|nr:hypothetical protein MLD38_036513 [Melastoma candidum]
MLEAEFWLQLRTMSYQNSCGHAGEDVNTAEESLLLYCKPVELYDIICRRSQHNDRNKSKLLEEVLHLWTVTSHEAFLKLHGQDLILSPPLFWFGLYSLPFPLPAAQSQGGRVHKSLACVGCWSLFLIKLWNHGLQDASTMNSCNVIVEEHRTIASEGKQS